MYNFGRKERKKSNKIIFSILVVSILMVPLLSENNAIANLNIEEKSEINIHLESEWLTHFKGTSWGHTVIQTGDGGYLVGGGTGYDEGSDALLIKTDSEGNMEWETTFGDSLGWDAFEGLLETFEGDFVASGIKSGKGFLAKVDANGNHVWEKTYGGSTDGYCIDVRQTDDSGFILVGLYYLEPRRGWLIKTDSEGNENWSKIYGGDFPVTFHSVKITDEGGFIISGWENRPDKAVSWAVKTDFYGNIEWDEFYGCDVFHSGMQTSDGGYIFTGSFTDFSKLELGQICLVKTDSEGNEVWCKTFGTPFFKETSLWVEETFDGGYIVIGIYRGIGTLINFIQTDHLFPLISKIWIIKTNSTGNLTWDRKICFGFGRCVKQTPDGGFILTGQKGAYNKPKGVLLIKTDENGYITLNSKQYW
jgi:hypothetical protein